MTARKRFEGGAAWVAREMARADVAEALRGDLGRELARDEARGSLGVSGFALDRDAIRSLATGLAPGGLALDVCNAAADYLAAARYVRAAAPARGRRPFLAVDEIVAIHALLVRRTLANASSTWRATASAPLASGVVPPAPWLVARDVDALVERIRSGPGDREPYAWAAGVHERLGRIRPFAIANGRTTRLVTNLLLQRLGLPHLVLRDRDREPYARALVRAASGEVWPLAQFLVANARATVRFVAERAVREVPDLMPLARIADTRQRNALYKAAERGRLRVVRDGARILTTEPWIRTYLAEREPAGRRPVSPPKTDS